jgi:hypothetical protein
MLPSLGFNVQLFETIAPTLQFDISRSWDDVVHQTPDAFIQGTFNFIPARNISIFNWSSYGYLL